jgi:hypothetical protein
MNKMKQSPAFWIFLLLPLGSCIHVKNHTGIASGRIDYKITYLNDNLDKKTLEILPKHMKLFFNEEKAVNNIEGFMGFYKLDAITDFHTRKCSTMLKVFDKHYLFKGKRDEMMCCFDSMDEMKIKETSETKYIAGLLCRKAVIYLPSTQKSFDIYYTADIGLSNPNSTNPYYKINGVLMEFELNLLYLKMRFSAEKFQTLAETSGEPDLPKNIRMISRDQMTEILNKLME